MALPTPTQVAALCKAATGVSTIASSEQVTPTKVWETQDGGPVVENVIQVDTWKDTTKYRLIMNHFLTMLVVNGLPTEEYEVEFLANNYTITRTRHGRVDSVKLRVWLNKHAPVYICDEVAVWCSRLVKATGDAALQWSFPLHAIDNITLRLVRRIGSFHEDTYEPVYGPLPTPLTVTVHSVAYMRNLPAYVQAQVLQAIANGTVTVQTVVVQMYGTTYKTILHANGTSNSTRDLDGGHDNRNESGSMSSTPPVMRSTCADSAPLDVDASCNAQPLT